MNSKQAACNGELFSQQRPMTVLNPDRMGQGPRLLRHNYTSWEQP